MFGALKPGDRVEVYRLGYMGIGTITEVSVKLERGAGTKLHPAFHVRFDDESTGWFSASSLKHTKS